MVVCAHSIHNKQGSSYRCLLGEQCRGQASRDTANAAATLQGEQCRGQASRDTSNDAATLQGEQSRGEASRDTSNASFGHLSFSLHRPLQN